MYVHICISLGKCVDTLVISYSRLVSDNSKDKCKNRTISYYMRISAEDS